ncbi:MAG: response regulator [Candidatus Omnitrophica bacterium]|nr:response regulator [Candidatus Omnitrophota bacterium]
MERKKRILIVDDEQPFTHLLKLNLEKTGAYEVSVVHSGRCALAAAKSFKPDFVFLDIIMPDEDGGSVAAQLRADEELSNTPIVFLTAVLSKQEVSTKGGSLSGHAVMAKPVSVEEVTACIEKWT